MLVKFYDRFGDSGLPLFLLALRVVYFNLEPLAHFLNLFHLIYYLQVYFLTLTVGLTLINVSLEFIVIDADSF